MAAEAPRALRVVTLRDRLVLTDVSKHLRGSSPWARNALIDAANLASRDDSPGRHLVLPFSSAGAPPEPVREVRGAPPHTPADHAAPADAAAGFLGVLRLGGASYAVLVAQVRSAGALPSGPVLCVQRVRLARLAPGPAEKRDRDFADAVAKLLQSGSLYYSLDSDITRATDAAASAGAVSRTGNAFWWTWPMARLAGPEAAQWALRTIYGFVGTETMRFAVGAPQASSSAPLPRRATASLPDTSGLSHDFLIALVSRRSRRRAGTRYITRGVDALGDVANFVETEQVVWSADCPSTSTAFAIIRGSVPVFWKQDNGIARPSPELDAPLASSRDAFSAHFRNLVRSYTGVTAVSLVDMHGSEAVLAEAFERHFELDIAGSFDASLTPKLVSFDFHAHCGGKEYERGLASLLSRLRPDVERFGFSSIGLSSADSSKRQSGVFRVNCVDCLDRTNVVQSMLARVALDMQLRALFSEEVAVALTGSETDPSSGTFGMDWSALRLYRESEDRFKQLWGDNADAVSKQYSGTGALKTDFTRTGKRSTSGIVGDGVKSMVRMYYKNFVDEGRQEAIDIVCGNANVRATSSEDTNQSSEFSASRPRDVLVDFSSETHDGTKGGLGSSTLDSTAGSDEFGVGTGIRRSAQQSAPLWYSFKALRMNAGGDRQDVMVELRDETMQIASPEGVNFEYPRRDLVSWENREEAKSNDRKQAARLRLVHDPSQGAPAAASPLDLLFRMGPTSRENFLRAYLSWASPPVLKTIGGPVRVRVLSARGVSKHRMRDWGLDAGAEKSSERAVQKCQGREIVALVVPEGHSDTRSWGLTAVPVDVDKSNYVLVAARAVSSRGPAIAVLASKEAAPSVMGISEAAIGRAGSLTGGGAVGISFTVSGTSLCFVSARLGGAKDLFRILSSLKLRRSTFDVTNQFEHFYISGVLGDLQWRTGDVPEDGPTARQFLTLGDGAKAYSLGNGLAVLRNSFPTLNVEDLLDDSAFWNQRKPRGVADDILGQPEHAAKEFGLPGAVAPFPGSLADASTSAKSTRSDPSPTSEGLALSVGMIDEVVDGQPAPLLPKQLSRCTVILSDLRGDGIKMPPGVDQATPLSTFFAVYSDFAGADAVGTRPTQRPTDRPEWRETIRLSLVPSDVKDVKRSFLLGQVLIPSPLADPIPAGHCVIPVSFACDGRAEFDVPLRLAGISSGRLRGVIELEVGSVVEDSDAEWTDSAASVGVSGTHVRTGPGVPSGRGETDAGRIPESLARTSNTGMGVSRSGPSMYNGSGIAGLGPALQATPSLEEVNEKLDAARRKGSKQIKSMVGKLSSFLNQSGGSGAQFGGGSGLSGPRELPSIPVGQSSTARSRALDEGVSGGYGLPGGGDSGIVGGTVPSRDVSGSGAGPLFNAPTRGTYPQRADRVVGDARDGARGMASGTDRRLVQPANSASGTSSYLSRPAGRPGGEAREDALLAGLSGSPQPVRPARPAEGNILGEDPLLKSLSRGHSRHREKSAVVGEDDLLAGLRASSLASRSPPQRQPPQSGRSALHAPQTADDDWGNFEEADAAPVATSATAPPPGQSLLDL